MFGSIAPVSTSSFGGDGAGMGRGAGGSGRALFAVQAPRAATRRTRLRAPLPAVSVAPMRLFLVIPWALGAALIGCSSGSFRDVKTTPTGGVVALEGARDVAHQKAEAYMKQRCPQGYNVLEEGDLEVAGGGREWRVKYECTGAAPAPAPSASAAPSAS